jgi:hypothetical protein
MAITYESTLVNGSRSETIVDNYGSSLYTIYYTGFLSTNAYPSLSTGTIDGSSSQDYISTLGVNLVGLYNHKLSNQADNSLRFEVSAASSNWYDLKFRNSSNQIGSYKRVDATSYTVPGVGISYRWNTASQSAVGASGATNTVYLTDDGSLVANFSIGSNISGAAKSSYFYRNFTVSGASATFSTSTSGTGATTELSSDGSTWGSTVVRGNGQVVYIRLKASSADSATSTHTVSASGGGSDSMSITTAAAPVTAPAGTLIPLGITSGAIDLNTLRNFFGNPTYNSNTISMSDLYRGGNLVPNITQNAGVPTSGTIDLADLYGAHTQLTIDKHPSFKSIFIPYGQSAGTAVLNWTMSTSPTGQGDVDTGYKALKFVSEFRWVFDVVDTSGNVPNLAVLEWGGVNYASQATSFPYTTPWHTGLSSLNVEYDYGVQTGSAAGTARLEVRKIWNGVTYSTQTNATFWEVIVENAGE